MNKPDTFSFIKGYTFSFQDDGNNILAWFACFSGREKVFVNDGLVSKSMGFTKNSVHNFTIDNNQYSIELNVESLMFGPIFCSLRKNGALIKKKKLLFRTDEVEIKDSYQSSPRKKHKAHFFISFAVSIIVAILLVYSKNYFGYSDIWFYLSLLSLFGVSYISDKIGRKIFGIKPYKKPSITDDE